MHIYEHACFGSLRQQRDVDRHMKIGLNAHAADNDLIIVWPDVEMSFSNIHGCFDTYGYTGEQFITK